MSDYIRGLLTVPAIMVGLVMFAAAIWGGVWLLSRVWPAHWAINGPARRGADVRRLFRNVNAAGRHVSSFRRLLSLGAFTIYVARYRPGNIEEDA